jgi:EmrB/QacA subfamily drug resistance transporter
LPRISDANRKWWILVAMTGSLSMILIDETVVGVALPTIQRDLDMSSAGLQWIVNAYLLALAALVAVGGRLGEMFGLARMFKLGAAIFVAASGAAGLADSETGILVARAVQGAGAALMVPPSGAIVINTFSPAERGKAMGIYAGISMIFLALGPLVGGLLTEAVTWRAVFFINLPVGVAILALAYAAVPKDEPQQSRMDWPGAATLVTGLTALVLALMQSQTWGWDSPVTISLIAVAVLLLPLFAALELRRHEPLVELRLFSSRNFSGDNVVLAAVQFGLTGLTVFGALFVQNILGFSPITAGLSLLPVTLPLLVLAPLSGRAYDRIGPRGLVAGGAALVGAGLIWNAAVLDKVSFGWLVPGYLAMGVGLALAMTPASTDCMNSAPARLRGEASGVMQTTRQVGGTIGLAVMSTIVAHVQASNLSESAGKGSAAAAAAANDAFTSGVSTAYYLGGATMVAAAVVGFAVLRRREAADAIPEADRVTLPHPAPSGAHPQAAG